MSDHTLVQFYGQNSTFWDDVDDFNHQTSSVGLSTMNFSSMTAAMGYTTGLSQIQKNYKNGKMFEEMALKFYGLAENTTNYYSTWRATQGNNPTQVRPDGLDNHQVYWRDGNGASHFDQLPGTFVTEVKAYNGTLELSTNSWQILGELDILQKNATAAFQQPWIPTVLPEPGGDPFTLQNWTNGPVLFLITTDNTVIGQSIIDRARTWGISIWQSKALWNTSTLEVSFSLPKFLYDKGGIYTAGEEVPWNMIRAMLQGGVNAPMTVVPPIRPNFDLDPEILE